MEVPVDGGSSELRFQWMEVPVNGSFSGWKFQWMEVPEGGGLRPASVVALDSRGWQEA